MSVNTPYMDPMGFVMVFQRDTLVSGWFLFAFRVNWSRYWISCNQGHPSGYLQSMILGTWACLGKTALFFVCCHVSPQSWYLQFSNQIYTVTCGQMLATLSFADTSDTSNNLQVLILAPKAIPKEKYLSKTSFCWVLKSTSPLFFPIPDNAYPSYNVQCWKLWIQFLQYQCWSVRLYVSHWPENINWYSGCCMVYGIPQFLFLGSSLLVSTTGIK